MSKSLFTRLDGVTFSAKAVDIDTGDIVFHHCADRALSSASVPKIFILHTALTMMRAGELRLDERLTRNAAQRVDESGIWYLLDQPDLTIHDIGFLMGSFSDNFATNVLLGRVTLERVWEETKKLGYTDTVQHDFLRWPRQAGAPRRLSSATANDLVDFFTRLAREELYDRLTTEIMQRWLGANADTSMVASFFEPDPLAHYHYERGDWIINKTGTDSTVRCDTGLAFTRERRVAYAVLANWEPGTDRVLEVMPVMREAGGLIHGYLHAEERL